MLAPALLYLALIVAPAFAEGPPPLRPNIPPKVEPTSLEDFIWSNPFSSPEIDQFEAACESSRTFTASEFQLHDLGNPEPKGLGPYSEALKGIFGGRQYPGGWNGVDAHGYERNLLKMEYKDVPAKVKEWIEEQEVAEGPGKGLFAVFDRPAKGETSASMADLEEDDIRSLDENRVVIFAPGAIYDNLPLWVAEDSSCKVAMSDISRYSPTLVDGGVVGWTTDHTTPSRREGLEQMKFTVKAQLLDIKPEVPVNESEKSMEENDEPTHGSEEADIKDEL